MKQKILSILLTLCMAFNMLPTSAFAEEQAEGNEQQIDAPQSKNAGDIEKPTNAPQDNNAGDTGNQTDTPQSNNVGNTVNPSNAPQGETAGDTKNQMDAPQSSTESPEVDNIPKLMNMLSETSDIKELNIADGNIVITATDYVVNGVKTPFTGSYVITGTSSSANNITIVKQAAGSTITLKDLDINSIGPSALVISEGTEKIQLIVEGNVSLKANAPAIDVRAPLSVSGSGNFTLFSTAPVVNCVESSNLDVEINGDIEIQGDSSAPCILGDSSHCQLKSLNGKITITGKCSAIITRSVTIEALKDIDITVEGEYPAIESPEDISIISHEGSVNVKTIGISSAISAGNLVTIEAQKDITIISGRIGIVSGKNISLVSHEGNICVTSREPLSCPGTLTMKACGDITVKATEIGKAILSGNSVMIEAQKDIIVESAGMGIGTGGNISLLSHGGKVGVTGSTPMNCGGNVTIDAYGDITVSGLNVCISSHGNMLSLQSTNGSINVKTASPVPAIVLPNGTVKVTAPKGNVTLENTAPTDGPLIVDGNLSISEGTVCILNGGTKNVHFAEDGSKNRVVAPVTTPLDFRVAESEKGSGYQWNKDTKTLTLNGLYLTPPSGPAISVPDGTTMILHGKNKISVQTLTFKNIDSGIEADGAFNVKGDGSLTMDNVENGILNEDIENKNITISGGDITINAHKLGLGNIGDIAVTGGNLEITSDQGVLSYGNIVISGGTITIHTKGKHGVGIMVMKVTEQGPVPCFTINGGTVNITMGEGAAGIACANGRLEVSGGTVTVQRDHGVTEDITAIWVVLMGKTDTEPVPRNLVVDTDKVKVLEGGVIAVSPWKNMSGGCYAALSFSESGNLSINEKGDKVLGASSKVVIVPKSSCHITFDPIGGSVVAGQTVREGGKAIKPTNPRKTNSTFIGWFKNKNCTVAWDFDKDMVTVDVTIYAKWKHKSSGNSSGGGSGGGSTKPTDEKETPDTKPDTKGEVTTAKPSATVEGTTATSAMTPTDVRKMIEDAVKNGSSEILIQPDVKGKVEKEVIFLPKTSVADIASKTNSKLTVITPVANVTIPKDGISALSQEIGTNISVSVEKKAVSVIVEVKSDDKILEHIKGGISVFVPVEKMTASTVVMLEKADGTAQVIHNAVKENGGFIVQLEGSASIKVVDNSKIFRDVQSTDWFYEAVTFVVSHQLFNGTSESTFAPEAKMTRGMIVKTFHQLANNPVGGQIAFKDVPADAYYANAVAWASANHIVSGYGDTFAADDEITREQLATFMYNYTKAIGLDVSVKGDIDNFADHDEVSSWASEAIAYVVGNGIMSGKDEKTLDPKGSATRGETASLLKRFIETRSK